MHLPKRLTPLLMLLILALTGCGGGSASTSAPAAAAADTPAVASAPASMVTATATPAVPAPTHTTRSASATAGTTTPTAASPALYFYLATNLKDDTQNTAANQLLDRAAAAGYTGVVYSDYWVNGSAFGPMYVQRLQAFLAHAARVGITVIPQTYPFGYSNPLLDMDHNLAEGQPVKGATFTVSADGTQLALVPSVVGPPDGGFEQHVGDKFTQWDFQDSGRVHADTTVAHGGACSLRVDAGTGLARVGKNIPVQPWRQYHVQVWMRTQNYQGNPDQVDIRCLDASTGQPRNFNDRRGPFILASTQGWTCYDYAFNSAASTSINMLVGFWGQTAGTVWIDDVDIRECALVNLVRRNGAPLRIYDASNNVYNEGADVNPITDPLAYAKGRFDQYHTPPTVTLPSGSRLHPGTTVQIDYYAVAPVYNRCPGACLTESAVQAYETANAQQIDKYFPAGTPFFLGWDEMRHVNSCASCAARGLTAGDLLAWHVTQAVGIVRGIRPGAPVYVWGDMFDPYQNAVNNYYFDLGTVAGSWNGLPADAVVFNWNLRNLATSLGFFSSLGHPQIIAGYYDCGDGTAAATREVGASTGIAGVQGLMYTTWYNDYSQLENYAAAVRAAWPASLPH